MRRAPLPPSPRWFSSLGSESRELPTQPRVGLGRLLQHNDPTRPPDDDRLPVVTTYHDVVAPPGGVRATTYADDRAGLERSVAERGAVQDTPARRKLNTDRIKQERRVHHCTTRPSLMAPPMIGLM